MNMNMSVTLNEDDLNEIIRIHLLNQGYNLKGKIRVNVGMESSGYGRGEHDAPTFKGITAEVEPKKQVTFPNSSQFRDGAVDQNDR